MKCPECKSRNIIDNGERLYCQNCNGWFLLPLLKGGQGRTTKQIQMDGKMLVVFFVWVALLAVFGTISILHS